MLVKYEYKAKKVKFLAEPQEIGDRLTYLLELKGIKVNSPKEFAIFYYCLMNFEEYQYCPWETRARLLEENYGIQADSRKLSVWTKKLIDCDMLIKTSKEDKRIWTTFYANGLKYQEPLDMEDKEAIAAKDKYWARFWELKEYYTANPKEISDMDKNGQLLKPSGQALKDCWREFGCCYYSCQNFVQCAWSSDDEEQAIKDIINLYVETTV